MHARLLRVSAVALGTGALLAAGLTAPAHAGTGHAYGQGKAHCRAFHATATGTDNGDGTTTATLYQGTREAGTGTGSLQPGTPVDGVMPFTGTIVLTTKKGTLTADVEGSFNIVTGDFSARSVELSGKGPMKNAWGRLRVWGTQDLVTNTFTETLHARVCVPKKQQQ